MKRRFSLLHAFLLGLLLPILVASLVYSQDYSDSQPDGPAGLPLGSDSDSDPQEPPVVIIPEQYQPNRSQTANSVAAATVYFTPQDENTSTTVLFLYNTSSVTGTVNLQTYSLTGSTIISTSINVPPNHLVRIAGDTVNPVGSWTDAILVNFRTVSTYAKMELPAGVKAEGYVAWNGGTTYDPLAAVPTLPLRFSIDPPTVFLPTLQKE